MIIPLRRIIKYSTVNGIVLPLNLGIAWGLTLLGLNYLVATAVGYTVQITLAFFVNRHWTFAKPEVETLTGLMRAGIVEASAFIIVLATTYLCVAALHLPFIWARIAAVIAAGIWCYLMDSIFTFRVKPFR